MKTVIRILALCIAIGLLAGCAAQGESQSVSAPAIQVSEQFQTPGPTPGPTPEPETPPTPEPTQTPVQEETELRAYEFGNGVIMHLPDGFIVESAGDTYCVMSFIGTSSAMLIGCYWYDADFFDYLGKDYPASVEAAAEDFLGYWHEDEIVFDTGWDAFGNYYAQTREVGEEDDYLWKSYCVYAWGEDFCWEVVFSCPEDVYDAGRELYGYWASLIELPDGAHFASVTNLMVSETELFTLELPEGYVVVNEKTTAADLVAAGYDDDIVDAQLVLDLLRYRLGGYEAAIPLEGDGMIAVGIVRDIGITQDELPEMHEALKEMYEQQMGVDGDDIEFLGSGYIAGNPNRFMGLRISGEDGGILSFVTIHDASQCLFEFSFIDIEEDEARSIMKTLSLSGVETLFDDSMLT